MGGLGFIMGVARIWRLGFIAHVARIYDLGFIFRLAHYTQLYMTGQYRSMLIPLFGFYANAYNL